MGYLKALCTCLSSAGEVPCPKVIFIALTWLYKDVKFVPLLKTLEDVVKTRATLHDEYESRGLSVPLCFSRSVPEDDNQWIKAAFKWAEDIRLEERECQNQCASASLFIWDVPFSISSGKFVFAR